MNGLTRRRALLAGGGALAGTLSGCLGGTGAGPAGGSADGSLAVQASFFVVYDFARNVAGDAAAVENLVPFGQHGHGWEPGPDVQRAVFRSDAFVYAGEGFQPWADDVVRNLRDDGADVAVIEAWADVDLLDADGADDDGHGDEHGHEEDDENGHDDPNGHDDHESREEDDHEDDNGHDDHDTGSEDHHDEEDHDHGGKDPHFWLDPVRAGQSVGTIASGLAEADPDAADTFEENASAYVDRLEELDHTIESALEDRTRDAILFAGHNSFRYLGRRYGFRVESLSGISPDETPSPRDVRGAQEVIEEHDVEHVLAPVFESDRAARQLVSETDAETVLPLTPMPSVTAEWDERGWGVVEVMEEVNLPSLRAALGAE